MPPRDLCRGCRECYSGVLKAIVQNPIVGAVMMGIPTYYLLIGLMFQDVVYSFNTQLTNSKGPMITLLCFTGVAWLIEVASIKWTLPNILGICAFCHSAVGSWWLVNVFIVIFAGWSYIPLKYMGVVLIAMIVPASIWHITGDIIREYKRKLVNDIQQHNQALARQAVAFDLETGMEKI